MRRPRRVAVAGWAATVAAVVAVQALRHRADDLLALRALSFGVVAAAATLAVAFLFLAVHKLLYDASQRLWGTELFAVAAFVGALIALVLAGT